jgi:hypothetical protein
VSGPCDYSEALIWTSKGNVLESDLDASTDWDVQIGQYIKVTRTWTERATGEVVKQSADVFSFPPPAASGSVGQFS